MSVLLRNSVMATKLIDYVRTYDNVLGQSICETIIKNFDESDSIYTDREQRPTFRSLNISERYNEKDPKWVAEQDLLFNVFDEYIEKYMKELDLGADFPVQYSYEEFRMKMYDNNDYDQFKDHVDVQDYNSARRFLVLFLYLNSVEIGGETNFPRLDFAVRPKCGRILVFPATWQYRHAGLVPVSDKKYIVGSYLHYL